ncbi:MAG TPA: MFS transporter [Bryobacteraceae bacterium]|nr:MFS transporter [Bryobacteraceae bacterium]
MATPTVSFPGYVRLLRQNRNFRLLWIAQIVSEQGDWLYAVAVYSLLLEFTGSAKSVALAFVLQVLPQFFVSPAVGVINDRISRKRVMIFADCARAAIVLCMVLVRRPQLVWLLYLLLLLETILWALFEPGRSAVIPNITPSSEVVIANALSSTTWSFNFAMGFAVGGVLAAYFGRDTVFVLNSLSFVASALLIRRMQFIEPHAQNLPPLRVRELLDFSPIREGIRYVWRDWRLRTTIFVKAGNGLMGANWVLLPILGQRIFAVPRAGWSASQAGMLGMSLLMACRGLGAILGPIVSGYWAGGRERRMRWGILFSYLAGVAGYLALGHAGSLAAACAGIVLAHAGGATLWVFSSTLLQLQTEDRFRGRVFSAEWAFSVVTMSLSSYSAGVLIDRAVAAPAVASLTGLAVLIPAALWALTLKSRISVPV